VGGGGSVYVGWGGGDTHAKCITNAGFQVSNDKFRVYFCENTTVEPENINL